MSHLPPLQTQAAFAMRLLCKWVISVGLLFITQWLVVIATALTGPAGAMTVLLLAGAAGIAVTAWRHGWLDQAIVHIGPGEVGCVHCTWRIRGGTPLQRHRAYLDHVATAHEGEHHA